MSLEEECKKVPIARLTDPKKHDVVQIYAEFWWVVTDEEHVLFFDGNAPQCNRSRELIENLRDKFYPGCEVRKIDVAFVDWHH